MGDTAMPEPGRARPGSGADRGLRPATATATATVQVTTTSTVAAGVYAPGHLGELTQQVPFELVDAVLEHTRATQQRLRGLPSRVGVYFLLALSLFPVLGYRKVWSKLIAGLHGLAVPHTSEKALRDLRRRLGPAPIKELFEVLAGPVAGPHTPGVRFGPYRTVAFDGCASIKVPDSERNQAWLGKPRAARGVTGYPMVELMTLVETGTRAVLGAVFGPPAVGETDYARQLLGLLRPDMLVLADRGFDSDGFLTDLAATGAGFLVRLRNNRRLPVLARRADGSFLSRLGSLSVRIICADITVTCADGTRYAATYRLATTLLDHRRFPARALTELYHERWEHELAYLALRHTLLTGRVLRSTDRPGLEQELWALLTLYQSLRRAMTTAVETVPGTDPDRASFTTALTTAQNLLIKAQGVITDHVDLAGDIGRAVLADLLPPRRPRTSTRKVKSPLSRYSKKDPHRPDRSTPITSLAVTIDAPNPATTTTRRAHCLTSTPGP